MNEYMYGVLITTDNTKIEIKNIITIHAQQNSHKYEFMKAIRMY